MLKSVDVPEQTTRWDIDAIADALKTARQDWRNTHQRQGPDANGIGFPSRAETIKITNDLVGLLFPLRLGPAGLTEANEDDYIRYTLDRALNDLAIQVRLELGYIARLSHQPLDGLEAKAHDVIAAFAEALPDIRRTLDSDVEAAFLGDPAARSVDEVLICYPGLLAIVHHRIAHHFYNHGIGLIARIMAEAAHSSTGIDIHPGARIGRSFFIDHGTGVVIGETAIIGERVRLYQAVTLGAKSFPTDAEGALKKGLPRHPIIEDDVVIYAGATILGRVTIGKGSVIGGNVWLTDSLPAGSRVNQAVAVQNSHQTMRADIDPLRSL